MTLERLPPQRDLSRLPLPFFDPHEKTTLALPFVLPNNPSNESLQAAGVAASWFGQLADYRGATFPLITDAPSEGNAILVVTGADRPANVVLPPINGPTLAVVPNPNDPKSSLLVIAGRNGQETVAAAATLTLGGRTLSGDASTVTPPAMTKRLPYDAPAWIPSDRPVKFGELVDPSDLQVEGWAPGTMRVPFRTAPDLYTMGNRAFPMDLRYIAPGRSDRGLGRLTAGYGDQRPLSRQPALGSRAIPRSLLVLASIQRAGVLADLGCWTSRSTRCSAKTTCSFSSMPARCTAATAPTSRHRGWPSIRTAHSTSAAPTGSLACQTWPTS